jgi:Protein of unknown function (DUF3168)
MSSAVIALRKAVRAALVADAALTTLLGGAKIYDEAPRDALAPYVTFGDALARENSTSLYPGHEQVLVLHVWSMQGGAREGLEIADRITFLLDDAALSLDTHRLINLRFSALETIREDAGRFVRVALRLRAVTESV